MKVEPLDDDNVVAEVVNHLVDHACDKLGRFIWINAANVVIVGYCECFLLSADSEVFNIRITLNVNMMILF